MKLHDDHVDGVRLHLWIVATNGHIVHSPGYIWVWRTIVMKLTGENFWFIHQSSLATLPAEPSSWKSGGTLQRKWWIWPSNIFVHTSKWFFTCCKLLWHGANSCTSTLKQGMLQIFIALKNRSPWLGLNPRTLGPMASTLTITPPWWLPETCYWYCSTRGHSTSELLISCCQ
jgi:hypothetical protein